MAGGNITGAQSRWSVVQGLLHAVRTVVQHVEHCEQLRREGADEFTQARARRDLNEATRLAAETAELSERLHAQALGSVAAHLARLNASDTHPEPPEDPPPQAA